MTLEVRRVEDPARTASAVILEALDAALRRRGRAALAVSGGSSPLPLFDALASSGFEWARVDLLQVDERVAPDGHPDRNAVALLERLVGPARVPATNVHLVPVSERAPEDAAAAYAATLTQVAPLLDVVHLGLGEDGHTASLVPGDPVLDVTDADVAATGTYQGRRRVTLTYPAINRATSRVWLVAGHGKASALQALLAGDPAIPAGRVRRQGVLVVPRR